MEKKMWPRLRAGPGVGNPCEARRWWSEMLAQLKIGEEQ